MLERDPTTPAQVKGVWADIWADIFTKRMKRTWTCAVVPWKRAQSDVARGIADVMITIPTEERRAYAMPSEKPVYESYLYVYTYKDHPRLQDIRSIRTAEDIVRLGLIPVTNAGNSWHQTNIDTAGTKTQYAPSEEALAMMIANKRADIMIDQPTSINQVFRRLGLMDRVVMTEARFGPIAFHIMVSKKSPLAHDMEQLNRTVDAYIRDGARERIARKYVNP